MHVLFTILRNVYIINSLYYKFSPRYIYDRVVNWKSWLETSTSEKLYCYILTSFAAEEIDHVAVFEICLAKIGLFISLKLASLIVETSDKTHPRNEANYFCGELFLQRNRGSYGYRRNNTRELVSLLLYSIILFDGICLRISYKAQPFLSCGEFYYDES